MTPKQFKDLREGDVIRNKEGHGYFVIRNDGGVVLVQRALSIHFPELWELVSRLGPVLPETPGPPPTAVDMMLALDRAGWVYSECPAATGWSAPGDSGDTFYYSLTAAYKSMKG